MLLRLFYTLRDHGVGTTPREFLGFLEALQQGLAFADEDDFYQLARLCLVKDETRFDRFDRAFAAFYEGVSQLPNPLGTEVPEDWLRQELWNSLSEEERAQIEAMGGLDKLMETLAERLKEQKDRHQGGNRWIGTGGTSPFGHGGFNPEGIRIGGKGGQRRAVKLWQQRQYRNLDDSVELGTRNIKMALRRLRQFARTGAREELNLDDTIRSTARNAGMLDIKTQPERHNAVKVLLFLDVGGSMDDHVKSCEALFSACRSEFKHLEYYYFHNFIYDHVWTDNQLRQGSLTSLDTLLHTYGPDYKVIIVGDASMSPYEIAAAYGSIDFMNPTPGAETFTRLTRHFQRLVWLNPVPEHYWDYTQSIGMVRSLCEQRMAALSIKGLDLATGWLQGRSV